MRKYEPPPVGSHVVTPLGRVAVVLSYVEDGRRALLRYTDGAERQDREREVQLLPKLLRPARFDGERYA